MKRFLSLFLALVMSAALCATAMAADVKGVTDTEIKIGQWGPQTGPAALWGAVARGTDLYFKMLNDEGGVNGRKITYYLRDDGYQPNRTKAIVKELVENEGVWGFVGGVGTSPGMAVMPYLVEKNIPWVSPSSGATHWTIPPKKNIFGVYPTYPVDAALLVRHAVETLKMTKVGFLYQNDDYGKGGLMGARKELRDHKLELAASVSTEVTDTDLSTQVLKLKEAGCEVVVLWLLPKQAAITLGTAAKMGFKPQFMTSTTLADPELMYKITKGLWKGVIFSTFGELPWSDHPMMVKLREAWQKYAPQERWGAFYTSGILYAMPMVEGIKRCGNDLSYDNFIKQMDTFKDWSGGLGAPLTFTPEQRQGANSVFLAVCDPEVKGMGRKISDWITIENFDIKDYEGLDH